MSVIKVSCTDQVLKIVQAPVIASGGVNEVKVEFDFCEKWDGFAKTALFYQDESKIYYTLLDSNDTCVIPWEVCSSNGSFYFTVLGSNGKVRRTATTLRYKVKKGVISETMMPSDPTPDVYDQIMAAIVNEEQISATVSDWLDKHPEATTTVQNGSITEEKLSNDLKDKIDNSGNVVLELDTSLTKSGTAADAKAVGDKIAEITGPELDEKIKEATKVLAAIEKIDWVATKETMGGDMVCIPEQSLSSGIWSNLQSSLQPGIVYDVFFNGEVYSCVARANGQGATLGNNTSLTLNDYPFCINWAGGTATSGMFFKSSDISYPVTLKVTDHEEIVYNKMPIDYLPDEVALKSDISGSGGNADGLSDTAKALLITILRNGVYSTDQSANITDLENALASGGGSGDSGGGDSGETEKTLTSISATYNGGDVTAGTAVNNLTGIVVTAHYSDGTSKAVTGYTLSGTIAEGSNTVTVTYQGKTATFAVTGVAENTGGIDWVSGAEINYTVIEDEYPRKTDGSFVKEPGGYDRTDYIYCYGADYLYASIGGDYNAFYDVNKQFVGTFTTRYNKNIAIPSNAVYFVCSASSLDGFVCKLYKYPEPTWVDGVAYEFTFVENEYVDNGNDVSYNGWKRTDYADCVSATKLVRTDSGERLGYCAWYDIEKNFISALTINSGVSEVPVPAFACYFKLSGKNATMDALVVTPYA